MSKNIQELKMKFYMLKLSVKEHLDMRKVCPREVADVLTSLSPDDDDHHKRFLQSHISILYSAPDNAQLFQTMELSRPPSTTSLCD